MTTETLQNETSTDNDVTKFELSKGADETFTRLCNDSALGHFDLEDLEESQVEKDGVLWHVFETDKIKIVLHENGTFAHAYELDERGEQTRIASIDLLDEFLALEDKQEKEKSDKDKEIEVEFKNLIDHCRHLLKAKSFYPKLHDACVVAKSRGHDMLFLDPADTYRLFDGSSFPKLIRKGDDQPGFQVQFAKHVFTIYETFVKHAHPVKDTPKLKRILKGYGEARINHLTTLRMPIGVKPPAKVKTTPRVFADILSLVPTAGNPFGN